MTDTIEAPDTEETEPVKSETPQFTIHPLRAGKQKSLYEEVVVALIDAQDNADIDPTTGKPEVIAVTVLVPTDKKGRARHLRDFREAAARHDRTARIREEAEQGDKSVAIDFTLTRRVTRDRKKPNGENDVPEISPAD